MLAVNFADYDDCIVCADFIALTTAKERAMGGHHFIGWAIRSVILLAAVAGLLTAGTAEAQVWNRGRVQAQPADRITAPRILPAVHSQIDDGLANDNPFADDAIQPPRNAEPEQFVDALQPPLPDGGPRGYQQRGMQDAPGVPEYESEFDRRSDPVPEYVYDPDYYNAYDAEIHQLADYAPPGYETRDYQSAPGEPEYRLMSPPVRVSQADRERYVVGGIVPGSFLVPGTNTSFRLRGFVRLAALYDFDPIGSRDAFVPNTIPVPQQQGAELQHERPHQPLRDRIVDADRLLRVERPHVHRRRLLQRPRPGGRRRRQSVSPAACVRRLRLLPLRPAEHRVHGRHQLAEPRRFPGPQRLDQPAAAVGAR